MLKLDMYKHAHYKGVVQSLSYASGTTFHYFLHKMLLKLG